MTDRIEVGDLVRTKRGYIGRVKSISKMCALLEIGFAYMIREPIDRLTKIKEKKTDGKTQTTKL